MSESQQAVRVGDDVALRATVKDGQAGDQVVFTIAAQGTVLGTLEAPVQEGAARAPWVVSLGELEAPQEVTFKASCMGHALTSSVLKVEAGKVIEPPELTASGGWTMAQPGRGAEVRFFEGQVPFSDGWLDGDTVFQGTPLEFHVELAGDGRGVPGFVETTFTIELETAPGSETFAPLVQFTEDHASVSGVTAVRFHWDVEVPLHELPGRIRLRFDWSQDQRPGPSVTSVPLNVEDTVDQEVPMVAGQLMDASGNLRPHVDVQVTFEDGSVAETFTNAHGFFSLEAPYPQDAVRVAYAASDDPDDLIESVVFVDVLGVESEDGQSRRLHNLGFLAGGVSLGDAVRAFQRAHGLTEDGQAGPNTQAQLERVHDGGAPVFPGVDMEDELLTPDQITTGTPEPQQ